MKSKKERLARLHASFESHDKVLITIDPDPDAIASALALKRLLWKRVHAATIAAIKPIKRWNNIVMVKFLRIPLISFPEIERDNYNKFVLVDAQPHHNPIFSNFTYNAVIDHHPLPSPVCKSHSEAHKENQRIMDVRPHYGSTSSILTEYLQASKIRPGKSLATALAYGIKTDTRNFERQTIEEDIKAFLFLYPFIDKYVLAKIEISDLSLQDLVFFEEAINNKIIHKNKVFVLLEAVPSHDILVIISEFFLKIHNIFLSIVGGIVGNTLVLVARSDGKKHVGQILNTAFSTLGSAGGHAAMARAEIPLTNIKKALKTEEGKDVPYDKLREFIISRVF